MIKKGVSVLSKERLTEAFDTYNQCNDKNCKLSYCDRECEHYQRMVDKLAEYENLEEQGLLLRLPCRVRDTVWVIVEVYTYGEDDDSDSWYSIYTTKFDLNMLDVFGETVFLTQSEAEEKLRELEGKENG